MKHVLILRILGLVLVLALVVNITIVLAVPLYRNNVEPDAPQATQSVAAAEPATQSGSPGTDTPLIEAPLVEEPVEDAPLLEGSVEQVADDMLSADLPLEVVPAEDTNENGFESNGFRQDPSPIVLAVRAESEQVLFAMGQQIGQMAERDVLLQRPIVNVAKRFASWHMQREPASGQTSVAGEDELPTVVIATDPTVIEVEESPESLQRPELVDRIVIENPAENAYTIHFALAGTVHSLKPGAQLFETGTSTRIRFHRGAEFGEHQQELTPGNYRFKVTDQGWQLNPSDATAGLP